MMGLIGDLIATNRKLLERIDVRLRYLEFGSSDRNHANIKNG